jgi:hypothetical protein
MSGNMPVSSHILVRMPVTDLLEDRDKLLERAGVVHLLVVRLTGIPFHADRTVAVLHQAPSAAKRDPACHVMLRHSDPKLTIGVDTHAGKHELGRTAARLPDLSSGTNVSPFAETPRPILEALAFVGVTCLSLMATA